MAGEREHLWEMYFSKATKLSGLDFFGSPVRAQREKQNNNKSEQNEDDIAILKAFVNGGPVVQPQKRTDYSPKFKTTLCRNYTTVTPGYCPYGDSCKFAHGADELRSCTECPTFKTKLCQEEDDGGRCPHSCGFKQCFYLHKHELADLIRKAVQKLRLDIIPEEVLLPSRMMTCKMALLEMVKDLVHISRSEQREGYAPKNVSSFLDSLHCKQNQPTLLFDNVSFPMDTSTSTKIASRGYGSNCFESSRNPLSLMSDPAANHNVERNNPFETFDEQISILPAIPESTGSHDEELDAIDKESRKLLAKLKFLEAKKKARTHELQKRAPAYNVAYYYGPEEGKQNMGQEQKERLQKKSCVSDAVIFEALEKTNSWTTTFLDNGDYLVV